MFKKQVHGMWYNMYDVGGQQRGGGLVAKWCLNLVTARTVACQAPLSMGFPR